MWVIVLACRSGEQGSQTFKNSLAIRRQEILEFVDEKTNTLRCQMVCWRPHN